MSNLLKKHEKLVKFKPNPICTKYSEKLTLLVMMKSVMFANCIYYILTVSAEKQRVAEEVESILKLGVDIDTIPPERCATFSKFFSVL